MHGGAIGFTSQAKVGSTFSFYVKARRTKSLVLTRADSYAALEMNTSRNDVLAIRSLEGQNGLRTPNEQENSDVDISTLDVLVVEDNLVNQRVLAKQLKQLGMRVAVANHGEDALKYLRTTNRFVSSTPGNITPLSLILMDWEMPGKSDLFSAAPLIDDSNSNGWSHVCARDSQLAVSGHCPWPYPRHRCHSQRA